MRAGTSEDQPVGAGGPSAEFVAACERAGVPTEHRDALWAAHARDLDRGSEEVDAALDDYRHWQLFVDGLEGDDRAASAFEACWRERIARSCGRRFTPELVHEIRSQFFLRVHRLVNRNFRWQCPFTAYLRACLANVVRDAAKQLAQERARQSTAEEGELDVLPSASRSPEALVLAEEKAAAVRRILDSLAPLDQQLIQRVLVDGESGQDVAASLGLKPQALYMRLHRARRRIAELLERRGFLAGGGKS